MVVPAVFAIAGAVLCAYARWAVVAGGVASRDGTMVEFCRPAPQFSREMTDQARFAERA